MIEQLITQEDYDWIWWIDYDTLITNTDTKLENLIDDSLASVSAPDRINFLLTPDCFNLNAGSMLLRSSSKVVEFLSRVKTCRYDPLPGLNDNPSEQDCMLQLIKENRHDEEEQVLFIPQWKMNAFPEEILCYDQDNRKWEPGMFVVHFAGAWAHMPNRTDAKADLFEKYYFLIDHERDALLDQSQAP
ncbi:probable alpha-1,2-galactosyltransferase gmh2 [Aspergillus udagawae]|uniref:Probable alpha-1,2-galactosyltransferase gmh2 n=1 Tax=Aspergillus udagawae TaxID=91492 RepID=A0ABQ1B9R7_9EURO|nr:probable alpha-1,2-galactosyltransferase gmh2 [Aspergillus udagawae]GFF96940.1 probable alpha-1,2-galactosyltransferase gmh2 [Aspergillus udagawae]